MGDEITIESRTVSVSREEAERRLARPDDYVTRLKHALLAPSAETLELSYKPFYAVDVTLEKERLVGDGDAKEGAIFVDAVTGIARARPEGYAELETVSVPAVDVVPPELDEQEAVESARQFSVKLERREKREATLADTADVVYKPVWVAELASGTSCVVDATSGEVFTDASFRNLLTRRVRSLVGTAGAVD